VHKDSQCAYASGSNVVKILDVECQWEDADGTRDHIESDIVELTNATPSGKTAHQEKEVNTDDTEAAQSVLSITEAVIRQLQVQYLQYARVGDVVVAER
jgi:shikimate 5-dehydrogenase